MPSAQTLNVPTAYWLLCASDVLSVGCWAVSLAANVCGASGMWTTIVCGVLDFSVTQRSGMEEVMLVRLTLVAGCLPVMLIAQPTEIMSPLLTERPTSPVVRLLMIPEMTLDGDEVSLFDPS